MNKLQTNLMHETKQYIILWWNCKSVLMYSLPVASGQSQEAQEFHQHLGDQAAQEDPKVNENECPKTNRNVKITETCFCWMHYGLFY